MKISTVATVASATAVASVLGYAVYFDYRRRNDVNFRRKLARENVKMKKMSLAALEKVKQQRVGQLKAELSKLDNNEPMLSSAEEIEKYFFENVTAGEALAGQGPDFYVQSALLFYKALRVYPSKGHILPIYKQSQPPEVYDLVMICLAEEEKSSMGIDLTSIGAAGFGAMFGGGNRSGNEQGPLLEEIDSDASQEKKKTPPSSSSQGSFVEVDGGETNVAPLD